MNELGTLCYSVHLMVVIDDPRKRIPDRRGGGGLVGRGGNYVPRQQKLVVSPFARPAHAALPDAVWLPGVATRSNNVGGRARAQSSGWD
jgi:hypothetical protein